MNLAVAIGGAMSLSPARAVIQPWAPEVLREGRGAGFLERSAAILANSAPGWSNGAVSAPSRPGATGARIRFVRLCMDADVLVLAHTDTLHGTLSGLATKKIMERAYGVFGDGRDASAW